jgi:hypothetical protein
MNKPIKVMWKCSLAVPAFEEILYYIFLPMACICSYRILKVINKPEPLNHLYSAFILLIMLL